MNQLFGIRHFKIFVITILLTLNYCHGHYLQMSVTEKRVCGAELADLLMALCHGKFNAMLTKKSVNDDYLNEDTSSDDIGGAGHNRIEESDFLAKLAGGVIFPRIRRSWMSITEDCCKNPCSVATLRAYCV